MSKAPEYIFKDHIGIVKNAFPLDMIDRYKTMIDEAIKMGVFWERDSEEGLRPLTKRDKAISVINNVINGEMEELKCMLTDKAFLHIFFSQHWKQYCREYDVLQAIQRHRIYDYKVQKTEPTQGYHVWHPEISGKEERDRIAVFSLFLNTVEEGGETEFLYQKTRVKPVENTLVIFPAGYTHTHRGNPPLSGTKYLLTGWVEWE